MLPTYKSNALYSIRSMLQSLQRYALVMLDACFIVGDTLNPRSILCMLSVCRMYRMVYEEMKDILFIYRPFSIGLCMFTENVVLVSHAQLSTYLPYYFTMNFRWFWM